MSYTFKAAKLLEAIAKLPPNPVYERLERLLTACQDAGMEPDVDWLSYQLGENLCRDWARAGRKRTENLDLQAALEHEVGGAVILALAAQEKNADDIGENSRWN